MLSNLNDLEFLDILTIVSFAMQLSLMSQLEHEATNNEVIDHIHQDIEVVNDKLDRIIKHLGIS